MSEDVFWDMTPRSFHAKVKGFRRREARLERQSWEQTRLICFYVLQPYVKKDKAFRLRDIMEFEDERKAREQRESLSLKDEKVQRILREMKERMRGA